MRPVRGLMLGCVICLQLSPSNQRLPQLPLPAEELLAWGCCGGLGSASLGLKSAYSSSKRCRRSALESVACMQAQAQPQQDVVQVHGCCE